MIEVEYKEFLAALGAEIRRRRKDQGWSLRDMVVQHGYHDSQWRKYESGGGLTIPSMLTIAALFQISLANLLDGLSQFPTRPVKELKLSPEARKAAKKAVSVKRASTTRKKAVSKLRQHVEG